jgi:transcriptional regulator with XRE-family HTH domain
MATRLRKAREARGWTVPRLIVEIEKVAAELDVPVSGRESLKAQISRWENGRARVGPSYRAVFREIFQLDNTELGFAGEPSDGTARLDLGPGRVTPELLAFLRHQLEDYARADNLLGPAVVLPEVLARMERMERQLVDVEVDLRGDLVELCGRYAEAAGWLYQDLGDLATAQFWSDRALDYAEETGDPNQRSYVLMRKSNIATDAQQPGRALSLAHAALREADRLTPRFRAVALRQQALASALAREETAVSRAVEDSLGFLADPVGEPDGELLAYCTPAYVLMEAGACWTQLDRARKATASLEEAMARWEGPYVRDRGLCLARLGLAYLTTRQVEEACAAAGHAAEIARTTGSVRIGRTLGQLSRRLAPYREMAVVSDLRGELREFA